MILEKSGDKVEILHHTQSHWWNTLFHCGYWWDITHVFSNSRISINLLYVPALITKGLWNH